MKVIIIVIRLYAKHKPESAVYGLSKALILGDRSD